ncbi:endonuclease I [Mesonia hippocampi]|uniref:Endonuclease I n=1 Tax=Mesonia hippocampi TaxID=1628250 RepID=A0A840EQB6_9FLAO|nr:endonuclease [Mesonia hippocampi]MBB4119170.1 endonuclease I [Mesonia hippocampi]
MKHIVAILIILFTGISSAQVVINELDFDNPGIDTQEFIELKSTTPYYNLDGYVLVFYNGNASSSTGNKSYFVIDLDGLTTDVNGLIVLGNNDVSPVPDYVFSDNTIQNGEDAVALYLGNAADFPDKTPVTATNLIDAVVYGASNDGQATTLLQTLGVTTQIDAGPSNSTNSIQRATDGSFYVAAPTPKANNDGSGIIPNGIEILVDNNHKTEGDTFQITFSTQHAVADTPLHFDISLANAGFNTADYSGNINMSIPVGQTTATTTINLLTDGIEEGDEELKISFSLPLPAGYVRLNDNIIIRVIDVDYQVASFGSPTNPTYGNVSSIQPTNYYNSIDQLSGNNLKNALQAIIANPTVVRSQTYADVYTILEEADQNPENSSQVWLLYTEQGRSKLDKQQSSQNTGTWNREHVFPRSRGGFYSIQEDDIADGKDVYWTTNADSTRHANSDVHAIRAVDGPENSARGNQFYGSQAYNGPAGNLGSFKGDVARSIFYLAIRYNALNVVNGYPNGNLGDFGDLATLLDWHRNDPPDDYEMNRNNLVYDWQKNRNPFIDQPDLVEYIWGNKQDEVWEQTLSVMKPKQPTVTLYPNPASTHIIVAGVHQATLRVFDIHGRLLFTKSISQQNNTLDVSMLAQGLYTFSVEENNTSSVHKLIITK